MRVSTKKHLGLVLLLAAAALVRLYKLDAHGPYWDEIVTLNSCVGSVLLEPIGHPGESFTQRDFWEHNALPSVWAAVIKDGGNAVLYYLLIHYWIRLAGTRDWVVRLPSIFFGLLVVYLVYHLSSLLFAPGVAWWAGAFSAFHPLLIHYSQEARGPMLATLLALVATILFIRIWRESLLAGRSSRRFNPSWILYGLAVAASLLCHYFSFGVFVGHAAFAAIRIRRREALVRLGAGAVLAALIFGGWMIWRGRDGLDTMSRMDRVIQQRAAQPESNKNFLYPSTPRYLAAGILQVGYAMSGNDLQTTGLQLGLQLRQLLPVALLPIAFLVVCWRERRRTQIVDSGILLLFVLALLPTMLAAGIAWRAGHIVSLRPQYAVFATPYLIILIGAGMSRVFAIPGWWRWVLGGLVMAQVLIVTVSIRAIYYDIYLNREPNPYEALAKQISKTVVTGDVVVYPRWADARICNLYLPPDPPIEQRVEQGAWSDASIRRAVGLPNMPDGSVADAPPSSEAILVTRDGKERARFANPEIF